VDVARQPVQFRDDHRVVGFPRGGQSGGEHRPPLQRVGTLRALHLDERVADQLVATKAAIRAGYSAKTADSIGHENLRKPKISEKLKKARAERAERCALSADWVVEELRKIGFANMLDYMKSTTHGDPYRDFFGTDA
jgi:hypothetical protein